MIYVEKFGVVFLVKEDLSDYVIIEGNEFSYAGRDYLIYDYDTLQEVIAPKALVWWPEEPLDYEDLYEP